MSRPENLPEYDSPPVNEVVLGVQFSTPEGYQQIYAGEVWKLFKDKFPKVEEKESLPPILVGAPRAGHIKFSIIGASHDRFWFISKEKEELLQFQQDRFLHNWRKIADKTQYERFDSRIKKYEAALFTLENYFKTHPDFSKEPLNINQCELTYINHIHLNEKGSVGSKVNDWLKLVDFGNFNQLSIRQEILDSKEKPYGSLSCEAQTVIDKTGKPLLVLDITVRGIPQGQNISSAISFLKYGRERIVNCFDQITTDFAHKTWGKK